MHPRRMREEVLSSRWYASYGDKPESDAARVTRIVLSGLEKRVRDADIELAVQIEFQHDDQIADSHERYWEGAQLDIHGMFVG